MTLGKFLAFVLRLSIVVGVGFGLFASYTRFNAYQNQKISNTQSKIRYLCAARISDEWLTQHTNEYGTIDVASICGTVRGEQSFFVNQQEIATVRAGKDLFEYIGLEPYNLLNTLFSSFAGFALTNFFGFAVLGLFLVGKWTIYGRHR
jgi:hypothetical protein